MLERTVPFKVESIADHYHDLLALRTEGLQKYRRRFPHDIAGPRSILHLPTVSIGSSLVPSADFGSVTFGPITIRDRPPIVSIVRQTLQSSSGRQDILEIGPGRGTLAAYLKGVVPDKIGRYAGLERDRNVAGAYDPIASLEEMDFQPSVVIASEVIEHMPLDAGYALVDAVSRRMRTGGAFIVGTPNALTPGGVLRDVTHVQGYPWFDLYALLRLRFRSAEIFRTHYLCTPQRLLQLVPRAILCRLQEMDWCEGLIAIAREPLEDGLA